MEIYVHPRRTYTGPKSEVEHHANLTASPKLLSNIMWPNEEDLLMIWYMGG